MVVLMAGHQFANAQCPANQVEVNIEMFTDFAPEENYWQLTPAGAGCGNSVIVEGANLDVGCAGVASAANGEEYPAYDTVWVGPLCLDSGSYDIVFVDSWGDGMMTFNVFEGTTLMNVFVGTGSGNTSTFTIGMSNLPQNDEPCNATLIYPDSMPVLLTNMAATAALGEPAPMSLGCNIPGSWCENGLLHTVWVTFEPQPNTAYLISTCDSLSVLDSQIALYRVSDCNDFSTYELVHSNDDQTNGCNAGSFYASTLTTSCLDTAYTYLIQVDGYGTDMGNFAIRIETTNVVNDTLEAYVSGITCPVNPGDSVTGAIQPYILDLGVDLHCSWTSDNGFTSGSNYIDGLLPGTYFLTAIDGCNQTYTAQYSIIEPAPWNVTVESVGPGCPNSNDGYINVTPQGATAPYYIFWSGPNGFWGSDLSIDSLDLGAYTGYLNDNYGCFYPVNVTLESSLVIETGLPDTTQICFGDELMLTCGTLPDSATVIWSDGTVGTQLYYPPLSFPVTSQVDFTVTISTPDGCEQTNTVIVQVDQSCTMVDNLMDHSSLVFPNPSNNSFTFKASSAGVYQVFDAQGKWLESHNVKVNEVMNIGNSWASGLYWITNGVESTRLVKQ